MPVWGVVSKIEPSHFDAGTAYVAVDAHLMDNREPFIFKTTDFGATWKRINGDLPDKQPAVLREVDRARTRTRRSCCSPAPATAFYYSLDDGGHWTELNAGLPHAPVSAGSSCRSRRTTSSCRPTAAGSTSWTTSRRSNSRRRRRPRPPVHLFAPRAAYRWTPPRAAPIINYSLKAAREGTGRDRDSRRGRQGRAAPGPRAGTGGAEPRVVGSALRPAALVALRTTPDVNPHIWDEPRFRGQETRPVTHWGLDPAEVGPLVVARQVHGEADGRRADLDAADRDPDAIRGSRRPTRTSTCRSSCSCACAKTSRRRPT